MFAHLLPRPPDQPEQVDCLIRLWAKSEPRRDWPLVENFF